MHRNFLLKRVENRFFLCIVAVVAQLLSLIWHFATPWTAARQASLSFTISQCFLKLMSIESVMPSKHLAPFSSCLQLFPASESFLIRQLFISVGQSTAASASASVFPMNIQDLFSLGLTSLISQSKGLPGVFSNTTVQKHQFFSAQLSLWSNSYISTWLLEKAELWLSI